MNGLIKLEGDQNTKEATWNRTITIQGQKVQFYDFRKFDIQKVKRWTWKDTIKVSGLIAKIGVKYTTGVVQAICLAYGYVVNAAQYLPENGKIDVYTCRVIDLRYGTVNSSSYMYSAVYKFIDYTAFENPDNNNTEPAYIAEDTRVVDYPQEGGESYYNSFLKQADAAYAEYLRLGEMP